MNVFIYLRIKSLVTGTIPGFVDVVANFNSGALSEDSLVGQWSAAGRKLLMFGDDTWTRLFPTAFARQDPTTSFFVSDHTEVMMMMTLMMMTIIM